MKKKKKINQNEDERMNMKILLLIQQWIIITIPRGEFIS